MSQNISIFLIFQLLTKTMVLIFFLIQIIHYADISVFKKTIIRILISNCLMKKKIEISFKWPWKHFENMHFSITFFLLKIGNLFHNIWPGDPEWMPLLTIDSRQINFQILFWHVNPMLPRQRNHKATHEWF